MDPVSPKTSTSKRHSWIGSVKARLSPRRSISEDVRHDVSPRTTVSGGENINPNKTPNKSGDENQSPVRVSRKNSIKTLARSIRHHLRHKDTYQHDDGSVNRVRSASPNKSVRMADKSPSRRKSLGNLFFRNNVSETLNGRREFPFPIASEGPKDRKKYQEKPLSNTNNVPEKTKEFQEMMEPTRASQTVRFLERSRAWTYPDQQPVAQIKTRFPVPATTPVAVTSKPVENNHERQKEIEAIVAHMINNHEYLPHGVSNTISIGIELLRKPRPYKSLRDIPSQENLGCQELDQFLEETLALRNPDLKPSNSRGASTTMEDLCSLEFDQHHNVLQILQDNAIQYGLQIPDFAWPQPICPKPRQSSTTKVKVEFPGTPSLAIYSSVDEAIAGIFDHSSELADFAVWDPVNQLIQAYPANQDILPELSGEGPDATTYIWLPNSWSNPTAEELSRSALPVQDPFRDSATSVAFASEFDEVFEPDEDTDKDGIQVQGDELFDEDEVYKYKLFLDDKTPRGFSSDLHDLVNEALLKLGYNEPASSPPQLERVAVDVSTDVDTEFVSESSDVTPGNGFLSEGESTPEPKVLKRIRIQDIIRPESVASSWYIPSGHSSTGSSSPLRASARDNSVRASIENDLSIDSKFWDGYQWVKTRFCESSVSEASTLQQIEMEVVAAVDHAEHISAPTDLETCFQPGERLRATQSVNTEGKCSYTSLCCQIHNTAGRPLIGKNRPSSPSLLKLSCCHGDESSISKGTDEIKTCDVGMNTAFLKLEETMHETTSKYNATHCDLAQSCTPIEPFMPQEGDGTHSMVQSLEGFHKTKASQRRLSAKDTLMIFESILRKAGAQNAQHTQRFDSHPCTISDEEAFSIMDETLRETAADDARVNIAEALKLTEHYDERQVITTSSKETNPFDDRQVDLKSVKLDEYFDNDQVDSTLESLKLVGDLTHGQIEAICDSLRPIVQSVDESNTITELHMSTKEMGVSQARHLDEQWSRLSALHEALEKEGVEFGQMDKFGDRCVETRNMSNISYAPGFKFSHYGDILDTFSSSTSENGSECPKLVFPGPLENDTFLTRAAVSSGAVGKKSVLTQIQTKPVYGTQELEKVNISPHTNHNNSPYSDTLAFLESINVLPVGKARRAAEIADAISKRKAPPIPSREMAPSVTTAAKATAKTEDQQDFKPMTPIKKVRDLVDIFQSSGLMSQSPTLQSTSRIGTPPQERFRWSNEQGSAARIPSLFKMRDYVNDWNKARQESSGSDSDTDVSSRFGEALERFGGVAYEEQDDIHVN